MRNRYLASAAIGSVCAASALALLSGCVTTRSISNAGYPGGWYRGNALYAGELSEFNVLGVEPGAGITEGEITEAFADAGAIKLGPDSAILLIQSGALFPDEALQAGLAEHFRVAPFSGLANDAAAKDSFAKGLRLVAARGGYDYIACYWGVLEAEQESMATKGVSWVPVVGRVVPDESQRMRIRLKLVLVDVRTGQWSMLTPDPVVDEAVSARASRERSDQRQVAALKQRGYRELVDEFISTFTR